MASCSLHLGFAPRGRAELLEAMSFTVAGQRLPLASSTAVGTTRRACPTRMLSEPAGKGWTNPFATLLMRLARHVAIERRLFSTSERTSAAMACRQPAPRGARRLRLYLPGTIDVLDKNSRKQVIKVENAALKSKTLGSRKAVGSLLPIDAAARSSSAGQSCAREIKSLTENKVADWEI